MGWNLAHTCVLVMASFWSSQQSIFAQQTASDPRLEFQSDAPCPEPNAQDRGPMRPEISIAEVTFSGSLQMPISDQDQIADSIKEKTRGTSLDGVTDEALERARVGWQDRGYFKAQITGEAKIRTSSPVSQRIALSIHMDEGVQYRLSGITFSHNKAISDNTVLRSLFPIEDGDIFSRAKIAKGLENLREAYGELGYVNFTSVPNTTFDDDGKLSFLDIDIDEDKQFYLPGMDIVGLDETSRQEILKDAPVGQIYNQRLFEQFLQKHASVLTFQPNDPVHITRRLDEKAGTVAITLDASPPLPDPPAPNLPDARPCPAD